MVTIRMQRRGRKGLAQFRVVVQDSRRAPTSERVIANLGFYNPHTKEHGVDLEKVTFYLNHGAQPSARVVKFLSDQKVEMPAWVKQNKHKETATKNPEKLRRTQTGSDAPVEEETTSVSEVEVASQDSQVSDETVTDKEAVEETNNSSPDTDNDDNKQQPPLTSES